jgi:hypothetical protein
VRRFGVDVVLVQPGLIRTEFGDVTAGGVRELSGHGPYHDLAEGLAASTEALYREGSRASDPSVVAATIRKAVEATSPKPPLPGRLHGQAPARPQPVPAGPPVRPGRLQPAHLAATRFPDPGSVVQPHLLRRWSGMDKEGFRDKADEALTQGEQEVDERTGGRFDEQTDTAAQEVRERGEGLLGDQQADEPQP